MISALCHPRPAEHSSTLLYPASGEEPPGEGESEAALRLPKAESRRQPEIQYTRALAEINSGLDLLTHSILRILAPRYRTERYRGTGLLPEVLHTDLLSRIIAARNTAVIRWSRCSSLPKYSIHVCTFLPNIFCVCFFTNHKNNGRKKVYIKAINLLTTEPLQ